jgi:putative DNA primase/helicase
VQQVLLNIIGDGGTILQRVGLPPKRLIPFQCDVPFRKISTPFFKIYDPDSLANRVEVLADGQQFVAEGIHPDTCRPYQWANNLDLARVPRDLLPALDEATAREFAAEATRIMTAAGWYTKVAEAPKQSSLSLQPRADDDERIASALSAIPADDRDIWFTVGAILKDQPGGRDLWDRWSQSSPKYDADDQERVWRSIGTSTRRATIATLFHLAQQHGWRPPPLTEQEHKPWRAAGYFLWRLTPASAWRIFQYWCRHYSNPPIEHAEAEWIFQTLLKNEY